MRLIDADKLIEALSKYLTNGNGGELEIEEYICDEVIADTIIEVREAPTVDAEPVRYGRWIRNDNGTYSCSECHSWIPNEQHYYARYCLFCGARMGEEKENENR